jgi:hypothetical protein
MPGFLPVFNNDPLARSQDKYPLYITFTLATAGSGQNVPTIVGLDSQPQFLVTAGGSVAPTQAQVDALLGVPNDLIAANFYGSTAMVPDNTYAFVLACSGQIDDLQSVRVFLNIGGTVSLSLGVGTKSAPTNTAFTLTQAFLTPAGNIAVRTTATGVSLRTNAGQISYELITRIK